ncbi:GNAT family N-acetyltransferase [Lacibacter sediminis]|uniref:GNAT family N-acetyltransferase n=1 Tax=Lacibacter sediminis TaxID=2760713 RepID=A0A7G5XCH4_9BACT|nr:GNAT family N-acetyltransferase [Lacibacter sediminis]QNA43177.1 GNAT family N-acetyltransferase [Lacibacter sediminis]
MNHVLENPVYSALRTGDSHLAFGTERIKYFNEEVSPYVGFAHDDANGFADLYELLPEGRRVLYAKPIPAVIPQGWQLQHEIKGLQFVYEGSKNIEGDFSNIVSLADEHVDEMIELVKLTKPGPFGKRTIDFGYYHGIFDKGKLVAMTGQRLHAENYTELSAVCTHPDHLGKGYASALMQHQLQIILNHGQHPFLHVRDDNDRAIAVYERLGFKVSRPMNFYFMKRL